MSSEERRLSEKAHESESIARRGATDRAPGNESESIARRGATDRPHRINEWWP